MTHPDEVSLVDVAVDLPTSQIDQLFSYLLPPHYVGIVPGTPVLVPFGPRALTGMVMHKGPVSSYKGDPSRLREIIRPLTESPTLPPQLVELALWLQDYYCASPWETVRSMFPGPEPTSGYVPRTQLSISLAIPHQEALPLANQLRRRAPVQAKVLEELARIRGEVAAADLVRQLGVSQGVVRTMEGKGFVTVSRTPLRADPWKDVEERTVSPHRLTAEQEQALTVITGALSALKPETILLHGVTGSGKTEIYLRAARDALHRHRSAMILVPEIALTPQTAEVFRSWFGDRVAILHSRLGASERQAEWWRIRRGEAVVVLGTRSAVFAPLDNLGLLVIDEEHETSYKQEESPRYHGRRVAQERARREGAVLVLGSATPALETYYRAEAGQARMVVLSKRVENRPMPPVQVVDMRRELAAGNRSIFSRSLRDGLSRRLAKREQTILFLNRRGYASAVLCRDCGKVVECRFCRVSLTHHAEEGRLICHYCGYSQALPEICPSCGSRLIRPLGIGTEKVQAVLRGVFPEARVARMDVDTTRQKGAHAQVLRAFRRGEIDILVGTQMVAKGLDFPRVTLVGVVLAETALYLPDFRSGERTYQLLSQVSGRAGRGELPGEVIIQTYNPEHYAIQAAAHYDWAGFYRQEVLFRRTAGYPPFGTLALLTVSGPVEDDAARLADELAAELKNRLSGPVEVLGPTPAPLAKLRGRYRFHIVLKGSGDMPRLLAMQARQVWKGKDPFRLAVDVDPMSLL